MAVIASRLQARQTEKDGIKRSVLGRTGVAYDDVLDSFAQGILLTCG
ncbi:hypothetical protein [Citrobacter koseri]|nr:hypothetical protein [Citrobacter koseri]